MLEENTTNLKFEIPVILCYFPISKASQRSYSKFLGLQGNLQLTHGKQSAPRQHVEQETCCSFESDLRLFLQSFVVHFRVCNFHFVVVRVHGL